MFLKKRVSIDEFAELLLLEHAEMVSPELLQSIVAPGILPREQCDEKAVGSQLYECLILALFFISVVVGARCGKDDQLYKRIIDSLADQFYTKFRKAGVGPQEFPSMEREIHQRFREYHSAWSKLAEGEPGTHYLPSIVATKVFGLNSEEQPHYFVLATALVTSMMQSMRSVSGLFDKFKVV